MKIITAAVIKDFKGEPIKNDGGKPVTFRDAVSMALNLETQDGTGKLTPEKKMQAFMIGVKLWSGDEVEITIEQAAFIKERVGLFFGAIVYGRVCELLEGQLDNILTSVQTTALTKLLSDLVAKAKAEMLDGAA